MRSIILSSTIRMLLPLMSLASVFLLLRGHNEPGGGFIGGLMLGTGIIGYAVVFGPLAARRVVHFSPRTFIAVGLMLAIAGGWIAYLISGAPFLTSQGHWWSIPIGENGGEVKLGPSLLFDIGVYLLVAGACMTFVFHMMEADERIVEPGTGVDSGTRAAGDSEGGA